MPGYEKQRGESGMGESEEARHVNGTKGIVAASGVSVGRIKFVTAHSFARFQFGLICLNDRWPKK